MRHAAGDRSRRGIADQGQRHGGSEKLLAESGYDGTPIVIMAPGDIVTLKAQPVVAAQLLHDAGFKVDLQATDWQTVVARRASQKAAEGGRLGHVLHQLGRADVANPVADVSVGGRGTRAAGSAGRKTPRSKRCAMLLRDVVAEEQKKIAATSEGK